MATNQPRCLLPKSKWLRKCLLVPSATSRVPNQTIRNWVESIPIQAVHFKCSESNKRILFAVLYILMSLQKLTPLSDYATIQVTSSLSFLHNDTDNFKTKTSSAGVVSKRFRCVREFAWGFFMKTSVLIYSTIIGFFRIVQMLLIHMFSATNCYFRYFFGEFCFNLCFGSQSKPLIF